MDRKHLKTLRRKEKKYFYRISGRYREQYESIRNPKISIRQNKKILKLFLKKNPKSIFDIEISFPIKFDIYNQKNSLKTIRVCNLISISSCRIFIDVSKVKLLSAAASALLITSIYKSLTNGSIIKCNYPKLKKSEAVLQKIGFFKAINKEERMSLETIHSFPDIKCWNVYKEDGCDIERITDIVQDISSTKFIDEDEDADEVDNLISKNKVKNIEISIKELVGNIVEHAYPRDYPFEKHWVLFVQYIKDTDRLILVLSDSGKTIPITFVKYHKENANFTEFLKKNIKTDNKLIQAAIKYGNTGTDKKGRGSGLPFVRESIINYGGNMMIYSKKGCYSPSKSEFDVNLLKLYDNINGTVINLNLPIESLI